MIDPMVASSYTALESREGPMNKEEMNAIVAGVPTKSEKIRLLFRAGVAKADIARFLGIRYQHVYNVLLREDQAARAASSKNEEQPQVFRIELEAGCKLTLPREFAEEEGLKNGDALICRRDPDGLKIMTSAAAEDYLRSVLRQRLPEQADLLEALLPKGRFRSP